MLSAFPRPAFDTFLLLGDTVVLDGNLLAFGALLVYGNTGHDQLHAARFTGSVLLGTVLAERPPLEIAALVKLLVEEAHVDMKP